MSGKITDSANIAHTKPSVLESESEDNNSLITEDLDDDKLAVGTKNMPIFSSQVLLECTKEDPAIRKKFKSMCFKQIKHHSDLNIIELHRRNEDFEHQKRKNDMELKFIARKYEDELEFQRKLQALEILKHEKNLGIKQTIEDEQVKPIKKIKKCEQKYEEKCASVNLIKKIKKYEQKNEEKMLLRNRKIYNLRNSRK